MHILVVEDHEPLRQTLHKALVEEGYAVTSTGDGEDGLRLARQAAPDAIVLDLMLPRRGGRDILAILREADDRVPVLVLTARDGVGERVQLLDAGADDYVVKPFDLDELLARLRAVVRRAQGRSRDVVRVADLEVDPRARRVRRQGAEIALTPREFTLLLALVSPPGRVCSRDELRDACLSGTESNAIDVYIGYLRRKIDRPGLTPLIHTRRGLGYLVDDGTPEP